MLCRSYLYNFLYIVRPSNKKIIIGSLKRINDQIGWALHILLDASLYDILDY